MKAVREAINIVAATLIALAILTAGYCAEVRRLKTAAAQAAAINPAANNSGVPTTHGVDLEWSDYVYHRWEFALGLVVAAIAAIKLLKFLWARLRTHLSARRADVGLWSRPDREDHAGKILRAWTSILDNTKNDGSKHMVAAFLKTYADMERDAVLGHAASLPGRRHVVTSFLAYSACVTAVVQESAQVYGDNKVVCVTTLPMPLARWFNYRTRLGDDALGVIEAEPLWETYKQTLPIELAKHHIRLRRCVLATEQEYKREKDFALITRDKMLQQARYSIFLPHDGTTSRDPKWAALRPYTKGELTTALAAAGAQEALRGTLESLVDGKESAYVIAEQPAPAPSDYLWQPLWYAFERTAHLHPSDCLFRSLRDEEVREWFVGDDPDHQMPEDMFAIGKMGAGPLPEWMFFFAGNVGREIDRVTLEFVVAVDEDAENRRFYRLREFADYIWASKTFSSVVEP